MSEAPEYTREQALDDLWVSYVKPRCDPQLFATDRRAAALQALDRLKIEASADLSTKMQAISPALVIWNLLAVDVASWFPECWAWMHRWGQKGERAELMTAFQEIDVAAPPTHRFAIDPAAVILPRHLLVSLLNALEALGEGEVLSLLQSKIDKRRNAWTWDRARSLAVQRILFLEGEGVEKGIARRRVATAMGTVNEETLRAWERDLRHDAEHSFNIAIRAGELSAALRDDPAAWSPDKPADAEVVAIMQQMQTESLSTFGQWYRDAFGERHRTPVNGGK